MIKHDYSKIIFDGYLDNTEFFSKHLERESSIAMKRFNISSYEFFKRCLDIINEKIEFSIHNNTLLIKELKERIEENYSEENVLYYSKRLNEENDRIVYYLETNDPFHSDQARLLNLDELNIIKEELLSQSVLSEFNVTENFEKLWFKVGLAFADGRIFDLYNENKKAPEIARELFPENAKSHRVYIYSSLENKKTSKNIFLSLNKMKEILDYLNKKGTPINSVFLESYESLLRKINPN